MNKILFQTINIPENELFNGEYKKCRNFYIAIMQQALNDLHEIGFATNAWKWFYAKDLNDPCSFVNICEILNLDPNKILKHIDPCNSHGKHFTKRTSAQKKAEYIAKQKMIAVQHKIGNLVKEKRKAIKITQGKLALLIATDNTVISKCELGSKMFSPNSLKNIKKFFNIEYEIDEILKEL